MKHIFMSDNKRAEQLAEVIQRELNDFFVRELEFKDCLVTLTQVKVTPDLKQATLFLSVLPESRFPGALKKVENSLGWARHWLSGKLRLRLCPVLKIMADESAVKYSVIEEALADLPDLKKL